MLRKRILSRLAVISLLPVVLAACAQKTPPVPVATPPAPAVSTATAAGAFDGDRAFALLKAQCDFGPRPMGTEAHEKTASFLMEQLAPVVDEAVTQKWTERIPKGPGAGNSYAMTNILGLLRGDNDKGKKLQDIRPALMLSAHWDTRPVADQDQTAANRKQPILGANDGASGVAVLLELARVLHAQRPKQSIVFAFWDAEDLGEFFYGSRHFAASLKTEKWKRWRTKQGILLDMVGSRDLKISQEQNSMRLAPDLWRAVHDAAAQTGKIEYFYGNSLEVSDDHIPLNAAGIPTIDLIDFHYPYWHTIEDTPDKCSGDSLKIIGDVVLQFIRNDGDTPI